MEWVLLAGYLVISAFTYVGLLRMGSKDFGVDWFHVFWALSGFIPAVGQLALLFIWVVETDWGPGPEIPHWIKRLAGD